MNVLQTTANKFNTDFILIQEPYLLDKEISGLPPNWKIISSESKKAAIAVTNQDQKFTIIAIKENTVAIKINSDNSPITIVSAYSSPKANIVETLKEIRDIIASIKKEKNIIEQEHRI